MKAFHFFATMLVAGVGLAACDPGEDAGTGDAGGVVCGDKICDPNATCSISTTGSQCECGPDFVGDGLVCEPLHAPATCAEVKATSHAPADGPATLYIGGDIEKPWTAWCRGMTTDSPTEYLDLRDQDPGSTQLLNTSVFAEALSPPVLQTTAYDRVRVDPATMAIDISDVTFRRTTPNMSATSTLIPGVTTVSSVPFATAIKCVPATGAGAVVVSVTIDLAGTPFKLGPSSFCRSNVDQHTKADSSANGKQWTLTAESEPGACAYVMPAPCTFPAVNGNVGGSRWLPLQYDQ